MSTLVIGFDSNAPPKRMISYAMAAMTGMRTMRESTRSQRSGSPTAAKTKTLTTTTVSRKLVPQRTWAVG